jgi:putative transcriptional regulator
MSSAHSLPVTVDDDWLAMQSAGSLSPFKQLLLTCQADINPHVREAFITDDHVAGALLESAKPAVMSDDFLSRLNARLDTKVAGKASVDASFGRRTRKRQSAGLDAVTAC